VYHSWTSFQSTTSQQRAYSKLYYGLSEASTIYCIRLLMEANHVRDLRKFCYYYTIYSQIQTLYDPDVKRFLFFYIHNCHHHHHKHQGLDPLIRSLSRVSIAFVNVSSVFQLFSFLVVCSDMISKGFGFVAFFENVRASSVSIHLSFLVCIPSVVHRVRNLLFCGHKGCSLPEVSITSFLPLQFFVSVRLSESSFLTHIKI